MNTEGVQGISIFLNAHLDQDGMEDAMKALKKNPDKKIEKWAKSKSFRYYGGLMHEGLHFQNLSTILGWNSSLKYVEYKNQSCGEVVIVGNGAE